MRARNVKPGFFKNEQLAELPCEARLLFIGLWGLADRAGRLEDRPKRIKMEVFPADSFDVEPLLAALEGQGLIARYVIGDGRYIEIPTWNKHQRPHHNEVPSRIPSRLGIKDLLPRSQALRSDSLNPDSLIPESLKDLREDGLKKPGRNLATEIKSHATTIRLPKEMR